MPASKVTPEIAEIRGVPVDKKCVSPGHHRAFSTPRGLLEFVAELRRLSGGKPTGFKLCVGSRVELLAIVKAILDTGILPDFVIVDGGEGGTGAAPLEFSDHGGAPLDVGLTWVRDALTGIGLRDDIRIGCSGKITSGFAIASKIALGADYTNAARAMMFAVGCIQAQQCDTNRCPVGVTTHDERLTRGLVVEDKADRVFHFQRNTVLGFNKILGAMGLDHPGQIDGSHFFRRVSPTQVCSYAELFPPLAPRALLDGAAPSAWLCDWDAADPNRF